MEKSPIYMENRWYNPVGTGWGMWERSCREGNFFLSWCGDMQNNIKSWKSIFQLKSYFQFDDRYLLQCLVIGWIRLLGRMQWTKSIDRGRKLSLIEVVMYSLSLSRKYIHQRFIIVNNIVFEHFLLDWRGSKCIRLKLKRLQAFRFH